MAGRIIGGVNNTRLVEGRNSIQSIISEFSRQITLPNGKVLSDAQGILVSGELDNLFVKDPAALTVLTELYNTHEHNGRWKNTLKGSGVEELKNPCISLLGASNEVLFDDFIQKKDVEGGFIARTFIVHESRKKLSNPLTDEDPDLIPDEVFVKELLAISQLKGEFQFSSRAKKLYRTWYKELDVDIENDVYSDKTGFMNRLGDSVLKVAMLLNLAHERDLVIHQENLEESIEHCESCLSGARIIARQATEGKNEVSAISRQLVEILMKEKDCALPRNKVLMRMYPAATAASLNEALELLEQAGCVKTTREDGVIWHRLLEPAFQLFSAAKKHYL